VRRNCNGGEPQPLQFLQRLLTSSGIGYQNIDAHMPFQICLFATGELRWGFRSMRQSMLCMLGNLMYCSGRGNGSLVILVSSNRLKKYVRCMRASPGIAIHVSPKRSPSYLTHSDGPVRVRPGPNTHHADHWERVHVPPACQVEGIPNRTTST